MTIPSSLHGITSEYAHNLLINSRPSTERIVNARMFFGGDEEGIEIKDILLEEKVDAVSMNRVLVISVREPSPFSIRIELGF